ncbi:MAG: DUF1987 domain-containing protein [Bacteroidales bacterium]|nr:DUF1987 domain-containing protein [Bacteroidales bacterium]
MSTIKLRGTDDTPTVTLDIENNIFEISGRSMPEDVASFYQPILDWIDNELKLHGGKIVFVFKMNYFNTASSKLLLDILIRLEEMIADGKNVIVHWYYDEDDEDMMEAGEEYAEIVEVPFEVKPN